MAVELDDVILNQIDNKLLKPIYRLYINDVEVSEYLIDFTLSFSKEFGSSSASFTLLNNDGLFGDGSTNGVFVGDLVVFKQSFYGSSLEFSTFYGFVESRAISKNATSRTIELTCLDFLAQLKNWDIDLKLEAEKYEVKNEYLTPNFLNSPNDMFAQVFNFANTNIAQSPPPILTVRLKPEAVLINEEEDQKYNGFEVYFEQGQVKLGNPFNARDNYDVVAKSYFHYPIGYYIEDAVKLICTQKNAFNKYLFNRNNVQEVIDYHLTSTFNLEENKSSDYLTCNNSSSNITIRHRLIRDYYSYGNEISGYDPREIQLDSVEGLPESGTGNINGDIFTWDGIGSGNRLLNIPLTGSYSLSNHKINDVFKYTDVYLAGQVWYFKYTNLITDIDTLNLDIPEGAVVSYLDKRYGRILLDKPISLFSTVKYNGDYSFYTTQASGIEINYLSLTSREKNNALEGIEALKKYVAPNYSIFQDGKGKIWSKYLTQSSIVDYEAKLVNQVQYLEDQDLYTHTIFYGKNKAPNNILYDENVNLTTLGTSYKGEAVQTELIYDATYSGSDRQDVDAIKEQFLLENASSYVIFNELYSKSIGSNYSGWHKYITAISSSGRILADNYIPILYINGVPVDNKDHPQYLKAVTVFETSKSTTSGGGK